MKNKKNKIGVLGCGNMASAMLLPLVQKLSNQLFEINLFNPTKSKAIVLKEKILNNLKDVGSNFSIKVEDNILFLEDMDYLFLGFKPQHLKKATEEINTSLFIKNKKFKDHCIVFSILAGVSTKTISRKLHLNNIARLMPNTPMLIGEGINFYTYSSDFDKNLIENCNHLLGLISKAYSISEEQMDIITPVSGSGPAYLFLLGEILENYLSKNGFSQKFSSEIAMQTLFGSAALWKNKSQTTLDCFPSELRKQVTSKDGVTETVLKSLEQQKIHSIFSLAIDQGVCKSKKLGEEND